MTPAESPLQIEQAALEVGGRRLWTGLDLELQPGELVAVLGPNGAGKSSLLRAVLGQLPFAAGTVRVLGLPAGAAGRHIGYVPQQKLFDRGAPLRARDLVGLGFDGDRLGFALGGGARARAVDAALERVGALGYAGRPVGELSGGEQQRLRMAQALVSRPRLVLADEPLLSLDLAHQRAVLDALDAHRRSDGAGVVLVTHDVNPLLGMVDRVLYLAPAGHRVGTPAEVLTGEVLSRLYGVHVDVLDVHGRIVVVAAETEDGHVEEPASAAPGGAA
ncbi:MAG: transporter ATP-binding protein [Naasia sp.]|nr:transporter ATP-binding protein [Naasia sp.]